MWRSYAKHGRSSPVAVSLSRLQLSQYLFEMGVMNPTLPGAPGTCQ
jgi:hypothetical protein